MKTITQPSKIKKSSSPVPAAEQANPKAPHRHDAWMPGDCAHQGDIILVALKALPISRQPRDDRQLADGDTKGSRHVLVGGLCYDADKEEIRKALKADARLDVSPAYIGPVISGACTIEHPEHAHQIFPDHVCTAVVYQRNLNAEEAEERVRD